MSRKINYPYFQKSPRGHYSWLNPDREHKFYLMLMNIIGIDCNRYNGVWRKHYSRFHDSGTNGFLWDTHAHLYKCKYLKVVTEISHPDYNLPTWRRFGDYRPSWDHEDASSMDVDVSEIAKRHGGGGHKLAAGFRVKKSLSLLKEKGLWFGGGGLNFI